jgi:DNA repair protein RadC
MEKLTINQWAEEDRPREKMMLKGAEALSDAELLAILIGSGNTEESAVSLMQRVLSTCGNDLNQLGKWEVQDFSSFKGFGPAKSITIMAALELGKRRKLQERPERATIRSFATWHTKNSGFYSLTRLPAASTNPASAAAASTRLLPTYAASCAKP